MKSKIAVVEIFEVGERSRLFVSRLLNDDEIDELRELVAKLEHQFSVVSQLSDYERNHKLHNDLRMNWFYEKLQSLAKFCASVKENESPLSMLPQALKRGYELRFKFTKYTV